MEFRQVRSHQVKVGLGVMVMKEWLDMFHGSRTDRIYKYDFLMNNSDGFIDKSGDLMITICLIKCYKES